MLQTPGYYGKTKVLSLRQFHMPGHLRPQLEVGQIEMAVRVPLTCLVQGKPFEFHRIP